MVDLNNELYFSKNLRFSEVNWNDKKSVTDAFKNRVETFYLEPAKKLIETGDPFYAFAVGVLCVSTIDFLACVSINPRAVGERFKQWVRDNISEFDKTLADRFYLEFRNGLVHEGRIKNCGQFSFDTDNELFKTMKGAMIVNPSLLLEAITNSFNIYINKVEKEPLEFQKLEAYLKNFKKEINYANQK
jgi:hypothetical protein